MVDFAFPYQCTVQCERAEEQNLEQKKLLQQPCQEGEAAIAQLRRRVRFQRREGHSGTCSGLWEPRLVFESPYGKHTVVGPVGYGAI